MDNAGRVNAGKSISTLLRKLQILFCSYSTPTDKRKTRLAFNSSVVSGGESFMRSDRQDDTKRRAAIPETTKEIKKKVHWGSFKTELRALR